MFDVFNLPTQFGRSDVQIFTRSSSTSANEQYTWNKPRGKAMCHIFAVGGGGGGGGGFTGIAGSNRGGGGGGGGGSTSNLTIPLIFLPDTLYVRVGQGGLGGAAGAAGGSAVDSRIYILPFNTAVGSNTVLLSGNTGAGGGGAGTGAAGGAAGSAGAIATIANFTFGGGLGLWLLAAGVAGTAGGAPGLSPSGNNISVGRTMGGCGGAGVSAANLQGGSVTGSSDSWISEQRPAAPGSGTFDGGAGNIVWNPFFTFGGNGGSSADGAAGGFGGNGAYGSGGGGGGGGTTGGSGGSGGNGIVIITCW